MGKKPVHSIVRAQAVVLSDSGLNQIQISKQLNISRHCVQNAVKEYKETRQYHDFPRTDRPKNKIQIVVFDIGSDWPRMMDIFSAAKMTSNLNTVACQNQFQQERYVVIYERSWVWIHRQDKKNNGSVKQASTTMCWLVYTVYALEIGQLAKGDLFRWIDILYVKTKKSMQNMAFRKRETSCRMHTTNKHRCRWKDWYLRWHFWLWRHGC